MKKVIKKMEKKVGLYAPELEKNQDLSIVLNGGDLEMKGATVPVKWVFSKELALQEPTHILLVDLTEVEAYEDINYSGRRYLVEVEKAAKFLQFFKSGKHTMIAMAFNDLKRALRFLKKEEENNNFYEEEIPISLVENNSLTSTDKYKGAVLGSTMVEFTVPKELFAKKPESKVAKICFNYLYWPNRPKPRDECQVKKIAIFYSLPKLPLFILANLLYAIYLAIASLILLFFGYQSISLKEISQRILHPVDYYYSVDVCALGEQMTRARVIYKNGVRTNKATWFSPFHITGFLVFMIFSFLLFQGFSVNLLYPGFSVLSVAGMIFFLCLILYRFFNEDILDPLLSLIILAYVNIIGIIFIFFRELPTGDTRGGYIVLYGVEMSIGLIFLFIFLKSLILNSDWYDNLKEKSSLRKKSKEDKNYSNYLIENFTTPEKKVDLKHLPDTFETNKFKRDLTIRFWSAKADVCKPYEI